ncbi:MAG TPA: M48 family metalloprotease [Capsulimonadaceae bacterium]|nr:M48 family metalloprotease [Capsulimonadaceae bacterium]
MCDIEKISCGCDLSRRRFITRSMLAAAGLIVAPSIICAKAADAGGLFDFMPSVAEQKKLGDQAAQQVLKQYKEVHDGRSREFEKVGLRLVGGLSQSDQKTWDFRFHVVDSKEVNAFALPGGNVFMFTGLYDKVQSEDALAAVTGHEMTHVRLQHWAKAYADQQKRAIGIGILLQATHAGSGWQSVASLADNMIGLKYSRGEEDQADAGGLQDMVASGYNPEGMVQMFQMLQKVAGNGGGVAGDFLSNHPLTSDRIKHTEARIAALNGKTFPPLTPLPTS